MVLRRSDPVGVADDDHERDRDVRVAVRHRPGVAQRRREVLGAGLPVLRTLAARVEQGIGRLGVGHRLGGEAGAHRRLVPA